MATVDPHDGSDVDGQIAWFYSELMTTLRGVLERTSKHLDPHAPVQSSNIMRTFWKSKVDGLVDKLEIVVNRTADHVRDQLQHHVNTVVTAAVTPAPDAFEIPSPAELFAEIYLRSRRGFLLDLGTDAWNTVRTELIAGLNDGESIKDLRTRVTSVADVTQSRAERIARTEVVGAMNAGSIAQVRASKLDSTKTWLATNDDRTRPAHAEVDGTTVRLDETFLVGGVRMDRPHDPTAPPDEVIQCRCTLTFEIDEDAVTAAAFGKTQPRDWHGRFGRGGGAHVASAKEHKEARDLAGKKIANAPVPSEAAVSKSRLELEKAKQGKGRAGGDSRGGSAAARRKQRENLFKEFGGDKKGYVVCHGCGTKTHHTDDPAQNPDGYARFERGKIFVKAQGGGYQLPNLLPECFGCNRSRNDQMLRPENAP